MKKGWNLRRSVLAIGLGLLLTGCAGYFANEAEATSDQMPPFGDPDSVAYSQALWNAMEEAGLAGPGAIESFPYEGTEPHGAILEYLQSTVTVNGHSGEIFVKRNYGPAGLTADDVFADPTGHLKSITVIFQREAGYDPEDHDYFWVKYKPDGSLHVNPKGMQLAGRVAKGMKKGCIACHGLAGPTMRYYAR